MSKIFMDNWIIPKNYSGEKRLSYEKIKNLEMNDLVKISNGKENFWVEINKINNNAIYGTIKNQLFIKRNYNFGDTILFGKHQICDLYEN